MASGRTRGGCRTHVTSLSATGVLEESVWRRHSRTRVAVTRWGRPNPTDAGWVTVLLSLATLLVGCGPDAPQLEGDETCEESFTESPSCYRDVTLTGVLKTHFAVPVALSGGRTGLAAFHEAEWDAIEDDAAPVALIAWSGETITTEPAGGPARWTHAERDGRTMVRSVRTGDGEPDAVLVPNPSAAEVELLEIVGGTFVAKESQPLSEHEGFQVITPLVIVQGPAGEVAILQHERPTSVQEHLAPPEVRSWTLADDSWIAGESIELPEIAAGSKLQFPSVGDLNSDGREDVVAVAIADAGREDDRRLLVLLADPGAVGGFSASLSVEGEWWWNVLLADIDGDSNLDVVVSDTHKDDAAASGSTTSLGYSLGRGNGIFESQITRTYDAGGVADWPIDFDGDGRSEFLVYLSPDELALIVDPAGENVTIPFLTADHLQPRGVADLNGDGRTDILVSQGYSDAPPDVLLLSSLK